MNEEEEHISEEDMFIKDGTTSVEVLNRTSELKVKAEKQRRIAEDAYNTEMINLSYRRTKPRGKERAKEIETIVDNFITSGTEDITERKTSPDGFLIWV